MSKIVATLGASVVALGALIGGLEAKTVFYEINGQRYSYDTNNRKQAAAARKQIEVAKVAEVAQAKAAAERASNPLVAIFGSQTQREAAEAQAQLEKIILDQQQAPAAGKGQRTAPTAKDEGAQNVATGSTGEPTGDNDREQTASAATTTVQPVATRSASSEQRRSLEPVRTEQAAQTAIKSVFLDAETGIKTIIRTDGSIQEELFDPGILSKLDSEHRSTGSVSNLTSTAAQPKTSPEDTTGTTSFRGANLSSSPDSDLRGRSLPN